jgi:transcriptional regulator with XRE-family HTH domain
MIPEYNANACSEPHSIRARVGLNVIAHRRSMGLTQLELGRRMNVPRTYISKIEGRKVTPTLSSLDRLARALGSSPAALVSAPADPYREYLCELRHDPFIDQIARAVGNLTPAQRSRLLDLARRLTDHRYEKPQSRTIPPCEEKQCFSTPRCSTSSPDAASKTSTRF